MWVKWKLGEKQSKDNTWKITMNIQVIILISNTTAFWNSIPQIMSLSNVKMEMDSSLIQTKRLIIMLFNVKWPIILTFIHPASMLKWADVGKLWGSVAGHTHIYPMWAARGCTHTELTAVFYGKAYSWLGHRKPMQDPEQFCSSGPPVLLSCLFPDLFFSLSLSLLCMCACLWSEPTVGSCLWLNTPPVINHLHRQIISSGGHYISWRVRLIFIDC